MKKNSILTIFVLTFLTLLQQGDAISKEQKSQGILVQVIEAFRHGSRYPLDNNKFWNAFQQKEMAGELSPTGLRQHYTLGSKLRSEYIDGLHFMLDNFNHTQIYIRSTNYNRTLMSAYSQLMGLYPTFTGPQIPNTLDNLNLTLPHYIGTRVQTNIGNQSLPQKIQVIPIHTQPGDMDLVLDPEDTCTYMYTMIDQYYAQNPTILPSINAQFSKTYPLLAKVVGIDPSLVNFTTCDDLYDVLIADLYNQMPLPIGMTNVLWKNLSMIDSLYWFTRFGGSQNVSIAMNSHLLQQFVKIFDGYIAGNLSLQKWTMFSAHDINIAPLMFALNISNWQCLYELYFTGSTKYLNCYERPGFASNVIIELYQTENQNFEIMVRYNGEYVYLCNSSNYVCSYTDFRSRLQTTILPEEQWFDMCNLTLKKTSKNQNEEFLQQHFSAVDEESQILGSKQRLDDNLSDSAAFDSSVTVADENEAEGQKWKAVIISETCVIIALASFIISRQMKKKKLRLARQQEQCSQ